MPRGRGRGRGTFRGRGKPRGRGGIVRRGARARHASSGSEDQDVVNVADQADLDIQGDVRKFFVETASFDQHRQAQEKNVSRYAAGLAVLTKIGVILPQNARVRALAASWSRKDQKLAKALLSMRENFGLVEVLKAVQILDSARQIRQLEKKVSNINLNAEKSQGKVKKRTLARYKVRLDNLQAIKPSVGSVSGALCRQIRRWAATFSKQELEFFALQMPTEPWRKLADIIHFNPDDFKNLPWFLKYCYGAEPPEDSNIRQAKNLTSDTVNSVLAEVALPFNMIKQHGGGETHLTNESKGIIVRNEDKVDRGIWWYEELACPEVDKAILDRLNAGEQITISYGKLMERLVLMHLRNPRPPFYHHLINVAQEKLANIKLDLDEPIAVLADASSSMSVAIRTATIVSSLLTASCHAELMFFNDRAWQCPDAPKTIPEVIDLAVKTVACRSTSHASALYPFYEKKQVVKTFIVVTDEEENTKHKNMYFRELFQKYSDEVYKSNLIFISFLRTQTSSGQMVPKLIESKFSVRQFNFSGKRPDLTKLDNILGQLSSNTADFEEMLQEVEAKMENTGVQDTFMAMFGSESIVPI